MLVWDDEGSLCTAAVPMSLAEVAHGGVSCMGECVQREELHPQQDGHLFSFPGSSGRLKLTVLSEDRLQMKWKETEGSINGYKVRVKPMAGMCYPAECSE